MDLSSKEGRALRSMIDKVLAIDDENDIRKLLEYTLVSAGFDVVTAMDGLEALSLVKSEKPQLIILDIMLPGMEGTDVLKELKRYPESENIPVIMLSARCDEIDRVLGYELGADYYMIKPFSPRELILRVRTLLKKTDPFVEQLIKKGPVTLDLARFVVYADEKKIDLTTMELKIFAMLVNGNGKTLERGMLIRKLCGHNYKSTDRTIDSHIRRLRYKLGKYKDSIETVRGLGYRFDEKALSSH